MISSLGLAQSVLDFWIATLNILSNDRIVDRGIGIPPKKANGTRFMHHAASNSLMGEENLTHESPCLLLYLKS